MGSLLQVILRISLVFFPALSFAGDAPEVGLGAVAMNLMEPVNLFGDFIQTGCFIIGASFLFASIIKYFEHRRSPLMVPISTVVFLFLAGIILILLPFLTLLIDYGVPFSLLK